MGYEGLIILGTPRSGTTLLRRLLDAHPDVCCPPETNLLTSCGRFLRSERIAEDVRIGVLSGLAFAGIDSEDMLSRLRALAFGVFRDIARAKGKSQWACKTAFDCFYLDELEQLCGEHSRFVWISRNGLDVVASIKDLCDQNGAYLEEIHRYVQRYPAPLEAFAHLWTEQTERIRRFVLAHPENAMTIRYEDLVAEPQPTMARVFRHIGADPALFDVEKALAAPDWIGLGDWKTYQKKSVDKSAVGRGKTLSKSTVAHLGAIMNPTLEACGYAPLAVTPERSEEEARRRYEVGLLVQAAKAE